MHVGLEFEAREHPVTMPKKAAKAAAGGQEKHRGYFKEDVFGGSKYEVSHVVGKGAYGVVWSVAL